MNRSRLYWSTVWPAFLLVMVLAIIALACSNSGPVTTKTPINSANQEQTLLNKSQSPLATHVVFSPLVGSGGTPAATTASPRVEISARPAALRVGEKVTVTVLPGDLKLFTCFLFVRDNGASDVTHTVGVSAGNEIIPGTSTSYILELVSASIENGQAVIIFQSFGEGTTEVWASVIPEGAATGGAVSGGVSQSILITVEK